MGETYAEMYQLVSLYHEDEAQEWGGKKRSRLVYSSDTVFLQFAKCFIIKIRHFFFSELNLTDKCLDGVLNNNNYESEILQVRQTINK